jgi:hypothetical protein
MGRVVRPIKNHAANIEEILRDPEFNHVYFDISWDEVAKYIVASSAATKITADLMNRYPDRFLFGTDEVAPRDWATYSRVFIQYEPLWALLGNDTEAKVRRGNYERVFDAARRRVRSWESTNLAAGAGSPHEIRAVRKTGFSGAMASGKASASTPFEFSRFSKEWH